jgi:hypothetical protein
MDLDDLPFEATKFESLNSQTLNLNDCFHLAFIHIKRKNLKLKQFKKDKEEFINEARIKYPKFIETSFLSDEELKNKIDDIIYDTNCDLTKKLFELGAYLYFCKLSIFLDSEKVEPVGSYRLIRLIKRFYICLFEIYLETLKMEQSIKITLFQDEKFINLRQNCAETTVAIIPTLTAFTHAYHAYCCNNIKSIDFIDIIKVRSGIECLAEVFEGIKIKANNKSFKFEEYSNILKIGKELEKFDESIAEWMEIYNFGILEDMPESLNKGKYIWWKSLDGLPNNQ